MSDQEIKKSKRSLTGKQELFCQHYVKHWNATKAAKEAGYAERSAMELGYQNLQLASVKERIAELTEHALNEIGVNRQRVLLELSRIAFVNMKDLATWNQSGVTFKDSNDLDYDTASVIAEVSETVTQAGGTLKIKHHDKVKAIELLGKHLKMFTDKHEHSGPDGKPIETINKSELTDEQLDAKIKAILISEDSE